jgi:cobalt-zinc-cadmium efflux system outer membrane protein
MRLIFRSYLSHALLCAALFGLVAIGAMTSAMTSAMTIAHAQTPQRSDTLRVSLVELEKLFLERNLALLAAKYNVEAARAFEIQAGLFPNPQVQLGINIYNPRTGAFFDLSGPTDNPRAGASPGSSEQQFQIQQLILLAGKLEKQVRLAQLNTQMNELALYDLLRTLKYQLRANFYDAYFYEQSLSMFDTGIRSLQRTVRAQDTLYAKGKIISLQEALRIKALLFSTESDRKDNALRAIDAVENLKVLIRDTSLVWIAPRVDTRSADTLTPERWSIQTLTAQAKETRPDAKMAQTAQDIAGANLAYQQALAIPDVTVGAAWDRAGSFEPNAWMLQAQVSLPFFNRNQGAIQAAETGIMAARTQSQNALLNVESDVRQAYQNFRTVDAFYKGFDKRFGDDYTQLIGSVLQSYERRIISALEFTDSYGAYTDSMVKLNQLLNDRFHAIEQVNYSVGADVIR